MDVVTLVFSIMGKIWVVKKMTVAVVVVNCGDGCSCE